MLWICRAGKKACEIGSFLSNDRIYLPWNGFNVNLSQFSTAKDYRSLVSVEKGTDNRTTISSLSGQLFYFAHGMSIGDYVLIPSENSKTYHLAMIAGNYCYDSSARLPHSRKVHYSVHSIPRGIFSQSIQYSLGAFRTLFKVHDEVAVLSAIDKWCNGDGNGK